MDEEKCDDNMQDFCYKLPKIELHAHLNGSLSKQTLKKLSIMNDPASVEKPEVFDVEGCQLLEEMFKAFDLAHTLTKTSEAVYTAAYDTIKEFCDDNVIYLELRSTPREEKDMSKKEYVLALLKAIEDCRKEKLPITVKLLLSVNRKQGLKSARENIHLAIDMSKDFTDIVGIDLSGDPTTGEAFIELLSKARNTGLRIAAHCAEVPNEKEVKDILKFKPDRIGHGTCIHPNLNGTKELFQALIESKIPVELCLTSNIKCKTVQNFDAHHFKYLYESNHPISLCTDDKGIFDTTLSKELSIVVKYFNLTKIDLVNLMKSTVNYTFTTDDTKKYLVDVIENFFVTSKCT